MAEEYDVVVVGGGISGLTTAYHLKKRDQNIRVLVLEAKDRVGGRTETVPLKSCNGTDLWDVGGQWVGRCQPHIMSLLLELGLETHPQYTSGKKVQQVAGLSISHNTSDLLSLSPFALIDLYRFLNKVESFRKQINPADPYACPKAEEWDSITVEHFVKETCYTQGAKDTLQILNRMMYGVEASQISLLCFLTDVSAGEGLEKILDTKENAAQEGTIKGGAQQVSQLMAKSIGEDNVHLAEPVAAIEQDEKGVKVTTAKGHSYTAGFAVLALPPPLYEKITFSPPLPETKKQMYRRMAWGNIVKIIVTYQEAFWRTDGFSGEVVSNGGMTTIPNCSSGPVNIVADACLHNGSPALVSFIAGDVKVEWSQQSAEARQRAVLDQLADYFGKGVYAYLDYREKDWNEEPYSLGGPACSMPAGTMPYFAKAIRQPFDRLHFAGTETATSWSGYMSGAVQSGLRVAAEILEKIRPQALSSEDYGALEGSRPATQPSQGLSRPRWMLHLRKGGPGTSFLKWTVGFCCLVTLAFLAEKCGLSRHFPKF
ncbi:putative flavin-containing monoamine oxidase A [Babylonia areolata]|uniref:putative flavin-containing monoamine oxidase A n=1 Tax=Babylonia areolata TaxID=304850 RepID=UPI003FD057F6